LVSNLIGLSYLIVADQFINMSFG